MDKEMYELLKSYSKRQLIRIIIGLNAEIEVIKSILRKAA